MSRILNNLSSDQRRRYRKQAAALKLEGHRICDRLPDKEKLVLSSNVEDRDSVMEPYFPQLPSTAKRIRGDAAAGKAAVFGIEHLTIKTGKPLTIRGHLPVVIHTAKVTMEPHAEWPQRRSRQRRHFSQLSRRRRRTGRTRRGGPAVLQSRSGRHQRTASDYELRRRGRQRRQWRQWCEAQRHPGAGRTRR
jgi:hypothetical protein